jgi:hypothetical protein
MKRLFAIPVASGAFSRLAMSVLAMVGLTLQLPAQVAPAPARAVVSSAVGNANAFLSMLDSRGHSKALFAFTDVRQRARWSNLPTGAFTRAGLRLGDLNPQQRKAAMTLVASVLSREGYEKVGAIMDADEVLKSSSGRSEFGRDEYYISILGNPSLTVPWMLQFGGHHLGLNVTVVGDRDVLTPSLTAVQPATYTVNGKTVRPLGRENDKAFALVNALDAGQRKQAILNYRVADLVLGPGEDGKTIMPEGIRASALSAGQQAMLLDLAGEWVGIIHESAAAARMAEIRAGLADTWFAWSGPTRNGSAAYFRIQGPRLLIEYAPQELGGDPTMHIHTIYRDPTNDYGKSLLPR